MDIQTALQKLVDVAGMTDDEIGTEIGLSQPTVTRLRNGTHKRTSFENGSAIMGLAKQKGVLPKKKAA
jgi:predicted XRE-type DNA-binding protein